MVNGSLDRVAAYLPPLPLPITSVSELTSLIVRSRYGSSGTAT